MMQSEFESLSGKRVTPEVYARIEKVYLAADESIDKSEFCNCWADMGVRAQHMVLGIAERYESLEKARAKEYKDLNAEIDALKGEIGLQRQKTAEDVIDYLDGGIKDNLRKTALSILGERGYLLYKLEKGYTLYDEDREMLKNILS